METVNLRSTAISSLTYNSASKELVVQFVKGGTETLRNISRKEFDSFKSAPSAGMYYNQHYRS